MVRLSRSIRQLELDHQAQVARINLFYKMVMLTIVALVLAASLL